MRLPEITSSLQQQQVLQQQVLQRQVLQQQVLQQVLQQQALQQQVLQQVQRLLLFCRKQPEPVPTGKRSATSFS